MSSKTSSPALVSFAVTRKCDLKCLHCYTSSGDPDPNELSTDEAKGVISEIAATGAHLLIFDGGEPLLREDLPELVKHAAGSGIRPVLGSNAMNMSREMARTLKRAGLLAVQISLDGDNAKTHDHLRGLPGAWEKTMQGIKNCAEEGLGFQLAPLMHPANFNQLDAIVEIARANRANAVEIFDFVSSGRGREHAELELDTDQRKALVQKVISYLKRPEYKHMIFRLVAVPQYYVAADKGLPEDVMLERFVRTCCAAGTRYATILPDGDVVPCMVLQVKAGNVRERPFNEIWENADVFMQLRDRNLLKGKCSNCRYRTTCAGARCKAYEKTGDMLAEDPTCWFTESEIS